MKVLGKLLFTILLILFTLGLAYTFRIEKDFFVISETPVFLTYESSQKAMVQFLKPSWKGIFLNLKGQNMWGVSLSRLRDQVLKNHWVDKVELQRRFPNEIYSRIHLKKIEILFADKKNKIFAITEDGEKLGPVDPTLVPLVPILHNEQIGNESEKLKKLLSLYKKTPNTGVLRRKNLSSIDYKPIRGLQLNLIEERAVVYLGEENIQTKGLRVLRVADYLKNQKQRAEIINASFTKKILVRLYKGS